MITAAPRNSARPTDPAPVGEDTRGRCSCLEHPDASCRSCAARRRIAARMRDEGRGPEEIAGAMRITPLRVMRLLETFDDRQALRARRRNTVATVIVRDLFDAWHATDPSRRTYLELARLAGYDTSSAVQRLMGVIPTSPVTNRGVRYPGRIQTEISCQHAGRLVRAMGHLPCDIPGL